MSQGKIEGDELSEGVIIKDIPRVLSMKMDQGMRKPFPEICGS